MDTKTTISATEARNNFFKIIENIDKTGANYTLTVNGVPKVTMLTSDEVEGWKETIEIMSDRKLMRDIKEGEKELARGEYSTFEEVFGMTPEESIACKGKSNAQK